MSLFRNCPVGLIQFGLITDDIHLHKNLTNLSNISHLTENGREGGYSVAASSI
jgi:hypothetical protein